MSIINSNSSQAKGELAAFVRMAKADGIIKKSEDMLLRLLAKKLNVAESDLDAICDNPDNFPLEPPINTEDRNVLFYKLIQMMKVDLSVEVDEIEFCKNIGLDLGISPAKIDDIIKISILKNKEVVDYDTIRKLLV